jgi:hypothetical protein
VRLGLLGGQRGRRAAARRGGRHRLPRLRLPRRDDHGDPRLRAKQEAGARLCHRLRGDRHAERRRRRRAQGDQGRLERRRSQPEGMRRGGRQARRRRRREAPHRGGGGRRRERPRPLAPGGWAEGHVHRPAPAGPDPERKRLPRRAAHRPGPRRRGRRRHHRPVRGQRGRARAAHARAWVEGDRPRPPRLREPRGARRRVRLPGDGRAPYRLGAGRGGLGGHGLPDPRMPRGRELHRHEANRDGRTRHRRRGRGAAPLRDRRPGRLRPARRRGRLHRGEGGAGGAGSRPGEPGARPRAHRLVQGVGDLRRRIPLVRLDDHHRHRRGGEGPAQRGGDRRAHPQDLRAEGAARLHALARRGDRRRDAVRPSLAGAARPRGDDARDRRSPEEGGPRDLRA